MSRPCIFVINLDAASERLLRMQLQAEAAGIDFERVPGIRGDLPLNLRDQFSLSPLSQGEIGCYAAHLEVCSRVVSRNLPAAMVLEDDVEFATDIAALLDGVLAKLTSPWDIVKLCNNHDRSVYSIDRIGHRHLVRFYRQPARAAGYLISGTGARKLLKSRPRVRPIDIEMRQPWHIGLDMYGICPPPVVQLRTMPSFIREAGVKRRGGYSKVRIQTFVYAVRAMGWGPALSCRIADMFWRKRTPPHRKRGVWTPYRPELDLQARRAIPSWPRAD